ncbi:MULTISPECIES: ribosome maturation factor RimM [Colwellia]|uniref:Ribosome maturation factor RimM n=1 Tax=Colwellia psychrerythraea (strain 34H / ATCC BAA-681) TaxID=167879 RepID=RIMM_COLP3|nr:MULTISPECIES: ribosome maturation factor RimM [Colwellia]Q47WU9.1 RecName: Full=Ribosome maturation factor RimM [Colwellia psychrerythraea 34H]AAZ27865.1 16S rRNA processing protein RimM [Colwellia psychrerythraea 34H]PKH85219.1 ribosome maturation factor RimM [Colwellia sp. Bg11-28]
MSTEEKKIILGKVGAVYGIKGWLKIHSFTDETEAILDYFPWSLKLGNNTQTVEITDWRKHNKVLIVKVAGIDDRDEAQALVGSEILTNEAALPELSEDDFYWRDLIGMSVVTNKGYDLGVVTDMMETGANDVLVVKANLKDGFSKKERLIPYLFEQVIESVSIENKQICVDWDPGF